MKKNTNHIIALFTLCVCLLSACNDDFAGGWIASEGPVSMKITLNLPASSSATQTRAAADELSAERRMNVDGLHLLVFEDGVLKEDVSEKQLSNELGGYRTLTAKSQKSYKKTIEVVVLVNMDKNGISFNGNSYIGQSKSEIYKVLKYTYGKTAWDVVGNEEQYIPMWGVFSLTPVSGENQVNVSLYRAVSKMNVLVNNGDGLDNFTLTSVRVYYANQEGYAAPLIEPISPTSVTTPSVESSFVQSAVTTPLVYEEKDGTVALKNRIYVPESNNKQLSDGKKHLCLVVGGRYTGAGLVDAGKDSFYRIDFKDKDGFYDALRNNLYIFNINSVSSPGTTTPEEALDNAVVGMDVTIESWNEAYLNGLSSQYSLVTDKSRASFSQEGGEIVVTVRSDYGEAWKIDENNIDGEWFKYEVRGNQVILTADANFGASRDGSFYIQVGELKKQIFVDQKQPNTANCYLAQVGLNEMSVIVKGNGTYGLTADGTPDKLEESAVLKPAYLSVIWETEEGLIKLIDAKTGAKVTQNAAYDEVKGLLTYEVKNNPIVADGQIEGGNALIGAFDSNGNVIWSWHIWVCPEMLSGARDQYWDLTKYWVMDRNLGALTNKPGVGSLGLLYQWGRKDPLIGAAKISADSEKMWTKNYFPEHDWVIAGKDAASKTVAYTIKNPTKLIHDGLSKGNKGAFLWGTDAGLAEEGIKDLGRKTIYDPCPAGYRVPPVDAFVFKGTTKYRSAIWDNPQNTRGLYKEEDVVSREMGRGLPFTEYTYFAKEVAGPLWISVNGGEEVYVEEGKTYNVPGQSDYTMIPYKEVVTLKKTSENKNWDENLTYIPNNLQENKFGSWSPKDYLYSPSAAAVKVAPYYGYYMNYNEVSIPKMKDQGKDFYTLAPNQDNLAWLPLSGAYNPETGVFSFKDVTVERGPSLTVNSFIWTNSSVDSTDELGNPVTRPAAMFLHGADPNNSGDGRHIHALNDSEIKAEPHYAGAVRCVRDTKKDFGDDNVVPKTIDLEKNADAFVESQVIAINESWRVIDPGAPWVSISPDRGAADKGRGTKVIFSATKTNTGSQPRTVIVKIQIGSKDIREVKITQAN